MRPIKIAVIGAGNRGNIYGDLAKLHQDEFQIVAVAEPDDTRRKSFAEKHQLTNIFSTWEDMLKFPLDCDVIFVTTQDQQHFLPVMAALEHGFHVVVEKPLSPTYQECVEMIAKAKEKNRLLMLCYVLRYTPFFQKVKELIVQKAIGDVKHLAIDMDVAYWHQAHSFVRGNWRNTAKSSPMILAKSCHDLDLFSFLLQKAPRQISSFGSLSYFTKENAPEGSTLRCTDGCKVEEQCPYSAKKIYLGANISWPVCTISDDLSYEGRENALESGPYGRCVFQCDNDVVDHQVVNIGYEDGTTATLTMNGFTSELTRRIRIHGTLGEINGNVNKDELYFTPFGGETTKISLDVSAHGMHAGGDDGLMKSLISLLSNFSNLDQESYYNDLLQSHYLAFQAEKSRISNEVIHLCEN